MTGFNDHQKLSYASLNPKFTPPEPGPYFPRTSLEEKLSHHLSTTRKIWISAPGGAGKTSLVRNYLVSDPRPLLWYLVDRGDQDPASFFHYLSLFAQQFGSGERRLPPFSPEYLPNLKVFSRNFFTDFFANFSAGLVVVFDDLQEGPGEALFGPLIEAVISTLPKNSALVIVSREEPYPVLARERLNQSLAHLTWEDLRLSAEESRSFLHWLQQKEMTSAVTDRAYDLTHGWLAGLLLFSEKSGNSESTLEFTTDRTELLFHYFASEIFDRLAENTRIFLLACAELPSIEAGLAEKLTGRADAGDILRTLVKKNYFTFRIASSPDVYRFHPLFRQFLQTRFETDTEPQNVTRIRILAAELLLAGGQVETAAELLIRAKAWDTLTALIYAEAETMLQQGRLQTLGQWLAVLPEQLCMVDPWLSYWSGSSKMAMSPTDALEDFSRAFALFDERDDALGCMLCWAMAVYAIVVGWSEYQKLDEWIARFDEICKRYPQYPSPGIEALMVQGIVKALTWRQPFRDDLPVWSEKLRKLVLASPDSGFRILAGSDLVFYHTIVGHLPTARALKGFLDAELRTGKVSPMQALVWLATRSVLEWIVLEREQCLETMETGRAVIEASGIHLLDLRLFGQGVTLGLTTGDLALAHRMLDLIPDVPRTALLDHSFLFHLSGDLSLCEGDETRALAFADMAADTALRSGCSVSICFSLASQLLILQQSGQLAHAAEVLQQGLAASQGMHYFQCIFQSMAAYCALESGGQSEAHQWLKEAFGLAAQQGYLNFHPWRDAIMVRLFQEALSAGIETDYVRFWAERRSLDLSPPNTIFLTPRELEILSWIRQGKTNWEMSKIQDISERTVKFHVANILRKLDATSRSHAVSKALALNLLSP